MTDNNKAKPRIGLYLSERQRDVALHNVSRLPWAADVLIRLRREGEAALSLKDEDIADIALSMRGQAFAYGISGCPSCRKPFPLDEEILRHMYSPATEWRNKTVTCPSCRETFPNARFPDAGHGFEHEGQAFYPIGMWNFHHAGELLGGPRHHEGLATRLVTLYALTGDVRFADKALVILDVFAAIFRDTIGPRDFTPFGSEFEIGRMHLLTSIVHRVKIWLASNYDWLSGLPQMERPSQVLQHISRSGTIRENVEAMLNDYMLSEAGGPEYNLDGGRLTSLNNHEADGVRAMLAVGLALGNRDYIRWGMSACDALLHNTIGRDGMYFEGSYGYSLFTGTIFLDIAYLVAKAGELTGETGFDPFGNTRFYRFMVENPFEVLCQGHIPCYGDGAPDKGDSREPDPRLFLQTYRAAVLFWQLSKDNDIRQKALAAASRLLPFAEGKLGGHSLDLFVEHPEAAASADIPVPDGSTVLGGAGMVMLRDANDTTLCVRVGPNLTHAHDDVLAYGLYSAGKAVSADLGYGVYGTNGHFGWMSKAAAHQTVVINEDETLEMGQIYKLFEGGHFTSLYQSPDLSVAEGDASRLFGIGVYRRLLAVAAAGPGVSYVADFFAVEGARTTDYMYRAFHSPADLHLPDATAAKTPDSAWTLAGLDQSGRPYFDTPGRSLGERLTTGETLEPLLEGEKKLLWTPEKNNGYGYIYDLTPQLRISPQVSPHDQDPLPEAAFRASWRSDDGMMLTWHGCLDPSDRVFTGKFPNLDGSSSHRILIVRDGSERKLYSAYVQVEQVNVRRGEIAVERLPVKTRQVDTADGTEAAALVKAAAVKLPTGAADYWIYSAVPGRHTIMTSHGEWSIIGRCGFLRLDASGSIDAYAAIDAVQMMFMNEPLVIDVPARFEIERADYDEDRLTLTVRSSTGQLAGKYVRYKRNPDDLGSIYEVAGWEQSDGKPVIKLRDSITLSVGVVQSCSRTGDMEMLETVYPLPLGISHLHERLGPTVFAGCVLIGERGGSSRIRRLTGLKSIEVDVSRPFAAGERFRIVEMEAGGFIETITWGDTAGKNGRRGMQHA